MRAKLPETEGFAERNGNRIPGAAPHGAFRCSGDDSWIAIAAVDAAEWTDLRMLASVVESRRLSSQQLGASSLSFDSFGSAAQHGTHQQQMQPDCNYRR